MKEQNHIRSAASEDAGNFVEAWLAYAANPNDKRLLDDLGDACAEELNRLIRSESGLFAETKQEALILLVRKFFDGNPRLRAATQRMDPEEVQRELRRSMAAAALIASRRVKRRRVEEIKDREECRDQHGGSGDHVARLQHQNELPIDVRIALALIAVEVASKSGLITKNAASAIRIMLSEGCSIPKAAEALGKSRQAVHQWIEKARKPLNRVMNNLEFPGL